VSDSVLTPERYVVAGAVLLTCVLFTSSLADPVNVIKLTALVVAGLALLALTVSRTAVERVLWVPRGGAAITAAVLGVAFLVSAIAAPTVEPAVVGTYGRNSGLLAYLAALTLFFVGMRAWTAASGHVFAVSLILSGLFTAAYGLLQYAGVDAIAWNNPFNPIIAALGNPDFASAYLGICAPAAAWGALWLRWGAVWRVLSALTCGLCLVAAALSSAIQGPLAAAAGLTILLAAWLLERGGLLARRGLTSLGLAAAGGVALLAAGAAQIGPAAGVFSGVSFEARRWYWQGALRMFQRHPWFGVGLDHYGAYWRQVRPDAATQRLGGDAFSDAAHSVPLQMLAQGGLMLALAYVAFFIAVAACLVRGLLRLEGQARLLMGATGGAWVAYTVQSLVSIDQVPLLTVQFAAAGAVVGLSGQRWRKLHLPGALAEDVGRKGRRQPVVVTRRATPVDVGYVMGAVLVALATGWFALFPLRASAAVRSGDTAVGRGDGNAALADYQRANRLLLGSGTYWGKTGQLYEQVQQPVLAYRAYLRGVRHDPFDPFLLRKAADTGPPARADRETISGLLHRAVGLDPTNPATIIQAADFATGHGEAAWSLEILARPLGLFPGNADMWAQAGAGYAATNDLPRARTAFRRALSLNPSEPVAKKGLASVGNSGG
jgi:putative inorganic carbon (HCO3(-)) transporter